MTIPDPILIKLPTPIEEISRLTTSTQQALEEYRAVTKKILVFALQWQRTNDAAQLKHQPTFNALKQKRSIAQEKYERFAAMLSEKKHRLI